MNDWRCASCAYSNVREVERCDLCDHPQPRAALQRVRTTPTTARPSQTARLHQLVKEMEHSLCTLADALARVSDSPGMSVAAASAARKPSPSQTEPGLQKRQRVAPSSETPQPAVESRPVLRNSARMRLSSTGPPPIVRETVDPDGVLHIKVPGARGCGGIILKYHPQNGIVKYLQEGPPLASAFAISKTHSEEWDRLLTPSSFADWQKVLDEFLRAADKSGRLAKLPRPMI